MKLSSGKRIGQSGQELAAAAFFSFFLHVIFLLAAVFLYLNVRPRTYVPPSYVVKLVGPPAGPTELPQAPSGGRQPSLPKQEVKAAPKGQKAAQKERREPAKKWAMPELARPLQKRVPVEPAKPAEIPHEQPPASASGIPSGARGSGVMAASVAVAGPQDFKFPPYLAVVREKIGQNWNPPPSAKDNKVKVRFNILRSGRVGDVQLEASSGNFYFDQAAVRAILSSSPFPPMPEGFYKEYEVFSVDLMEKE
jgi:TonB family protein